MVLLFVGVLITTATLLLGCDVSSESALPTPTESPAPTKVAFAVPSSTWTPTNTPTATRTPSATPTRTRTRIPTATSTRTPKPSNTPSIPLQIPSIPATPTPRVSSAAIILPDEKYSTLTVIGSTAPHLPANVNLSVRGFTATNVFAGLVDIDGQFDPAVPQMYRLFTDSRTPTFVSVYQLYQWDDACNCRGALIDYPDVTMAGLASNPGEVLRVPESGYNIGDGFQVLVVYADAERIVFTYGREDSPIRGYAVYLEGISVEPNLIALYQQADRAGRGALPALRAGQGLARARGSEIKFAMRDAGAFLDPRSRKDWWRR